MKTEIDTRDRLEQICEVSSWFESLGLSVENNRFSNAQAILKKFVTLGDVNQEAMLEYQCAAEGLDDFWLVHSALKDDGKKIVPVLELALKGAHNRMNETSNSAKGRNFLFELVTAARFIGLGMQVRFEGEADFIVEVNGTDVFVECKRGGDIDGLLKKAFKQINVRCKTRAHSAGIAVICTTPIVTENMRRHGPLVADMESMQHEIQDIVSKFDFSKFRTYCPRGLGVVTKFVVPFWDRNEMNLETLRRIDFHPLCPDSDPLLLWLKERWR